MKQRYTSTMPTTDYNPYDNISSSFSTTYTAIIVVIVVAVIVKIAIITFCCMRMNKRKKARREAYTMNNVNGAENGYSNTTYNNGEVVLATRDASGRPVWNNGGGVYRPQDAQGAYTKLPNVMNEPLPIYTRDRPASPVLQGYENNR